MHSLMVPQLKRKNPNKRDLKLQVSLNQLEPGPGGAFICSMLQAAGKGLRQ